MDDETISVLRTVCVAGGARPGFNGDSNARLEQLVEAGLLVVEEVSSADPKAAARTRFYRPTKRGVTMVQKLKQRGVA